MLKGRNRAYMCLLLCSDHPMLDSVWSVIEGYCLRYSPKISGAANTAAPIIIHPAGILENTIKWNAAEGRRKLKSKWSNLPSHPLFNVGCVCACASKLLCASPSTLKRGYRGKIEVALQPSVVDKPKIWKIVKHVSHLLRFVICHYESNCLLRF